MQEMRDSDFGYAHISNYRQSHNSYELEEPQSPRSLNSVFLQDQDIHISCLDSVSQNNLAFQDTEEIERRHYIQHNSSTHISPRGAKYRMEASNKAKLAKIITVPGDKHDTGNYSPTVPKAVATPSGTLKGAPSNQGSMRGVPAPQGSLRGVPQVKATVRASATYPGSVRGYHMANGHLPQTRQRLHSSESRSGSVAFRRHRPERKEYYVTQFDIEFDKHNRHRFLPGEELTGKIIFDISHEMEVRFVELLIIGQTNATFIHNESGVSTTKHDVFLSKRSYIIGTPDGRWTSVITAGHYVSNFRFQLPNAIPTSTSYEDRINGFTMETVYHVKARICDDVGASSARSTHSMNNFVKVLVSRRQKFNVKRPFDIHSVPMAMTPITHLEDVPITCSIFAVHEPGNILMALDRSCFLAGDDIKIRLEAQNRYASRIKKITCVLRQTIHVKGVRSKAQFNIANVEEKYPEGTTSKTKKHKLIFYEIHLPTHTNFLPSVMPGCRLVSVTYSLIVAIKFSTCGGKLTLEIPINIGPCTDPIHLDKTNSVPFFNRPLRFPHFSPHSNGIANGDAKIITDRPGSAPQVSSKFSYGACSNKFCCCFGDNTLI